jgi:hypothetical protein
MAGLSAQQEHEGKCEIAKNGTTRCESKHDSAVLTDLGSSGHTSLARAESPTVA